AREQHGDRATDAGVPTGDDGDLAFQFFAADVVRSQVPRLQVEIGLDARLGQVLARHRIDRLPARAGLYRLALVLRGLGASFGRLRALGDLFLATRGLACALARGGCCGTRCSWGHGATPTWVAR